MNRDDIIRMAREAGFVVDEVSQQHQPNCIFHTHYLVDELLERFAALVAAHEREVCARVCDKRAAGYRMGFEEKYEAQACAYDIRARSEK